MKQVNESKNKIAEILKALAHPARIGILHFLNEKKGVKISVKQIYESLELAQSETSRHLIIMKNASVLKCEKEGANSYYSINDKFSFIQCISLCLMKL